MATSGGWYVVRKGRKPGIYTTWDDCLQVTHGYAGALYRKYAHYDDAYSAFHDPLGYHSSVKNKKHTHDIQKFLGDDYLVSICTDAACSGNPGILSFQGKIIASDETIFSYGPYPLGTVNIGEFLGIVAGLRYCIDHPQYHIVYSDSLIALSWVKKSICRTQLSYSEQTKTLYEQIDDALQRLKKYNPLDTIQIKKWDTDKWGEIPADYGRK